MSGCDCNGLPPGLAFNNLDFSVATYHELSLWTIFPAPPPPRVLVPLPASNDELSVEKCVCSAQRWLARRVLEAASALAVLTLWWLRLLFRLAAKKKKKTHIFFRMCEVMPICRYYLAIVVNRPRISRIGKEEEEEVSHPVKVTLCCTVPVGRWLKTNQSCLRSLRKTGWNASWKKIKIKWIF